MLEIGELDDALILHVFSGLLPLPDLFNVAASCRRFRDLALDRRSWLYVTHATIASADGAPPRRHAQPLPHRAASAASLPGTATSALSLSAAAEAQHSAPHWYRSQFSTLEAALAASRPGDTVLLEAGPVPHVIAAPLAVPHPVHILGGGTDAGECVLLGAPGLDAMLDFRASARLANLTLKATSGACVAHTRGRLTVQGCNLECDARGLPHLVAPLLTRAASCPRMQPCTAATATAGSTGTLPPANPASISEPALAASAAARQAPAKKRPAAAAVEACNSMPGNNAEGGAAAAEAAAEAPAAKRLRLWRQAAEAAVGPGVLSVAESRIKHVGRAVELQGSGRLSAVRAIYNHSYSLMWLEVDSADFPPEARHVSAASLAPAGEASAAGGSGGGAAVPAVPGLPAVPVATKASPLPSWAARAAAAGFDTAAFQLRAQQFGTAAATAAAKVPAPAANSSHQQLAPGSAAMADADKERVEEAMGEAGMELKAEEWYGV